MAISNVELYDNEYLKGLNLEGPTKDVELQGKLALQARKDATSIYRMYNSPNDIIPFTTTLATVGKTDKKAVTYSWNTLYNKNGQIRYFQSGRVVEPNSDGSYIVNVNNFRNTTVRTMDSAQRVHSAINPGAGSPIRLTPPSGFAGYIQCLTKNNTVGTVQLASAPSDIQNNITTNNATDDAIGASQSFNFFSSVGSRVVSFSFDVYADYLPSPFNDVLSYCKALLQMNYPTYSSQEVNSPAVKFEYGGIRIIGLPQITCTFSNTIKKGIVDKAQVSVSITETETITDEKVIV